MNRQLYYHLFKILWVKNLKIIILLFFLTGTDLSAQEDEENVSHYVFADFILGNVKQKDGNSFSTLLNYNTLTEEMIFMNNGTNLALDKIETIDSVIINKHIYIPKDKAFFEQLLAGKISLFIQHKSELETKGNQVGYGGTSLISSTSKMSTLSSSGLVYNLKLPAEYSIEDNTHYWIRFNNKYYQIENEKSLRKIFVDYEKEIKSFIKSNKVKFTDESGLRKLVEHLNNIAR